ncbi:MAG: DUF393 domain-containing protein [Croceibacterium sp.]
MDRLTVWHDGACPLCQREIRFLRRLDRAGAIEFINVAGPQAIDSPIDRRLLLERFHVREDGRMLSGAAAFAAVWRSIPRLRPLGLAARNKVVLYLLEILYVAFLSARPQLQRLAFRWTRR